MNDDIRAVEFLGTGEAWDERCGNTSVLLRGDTNILLDCGPSAPPALWKTLSGADTLDAVWLSHWHGDHCFGLPFLLGRARDEGRRKPLAILGRPGTGARVEEIVRLAYRSLWDELGFELEFVEPAEGQLAIWRGLRIATAPTDHSAPNLAVRFETRRGPICYSGDGAPSVASSSLFSGARVLVHESFTDGEPPPGHGTTQAVVDVARRAGVDTLALVHLSRAYREAGVTLPLHEASLLVCVPEPGDVIEL